MNDLKENVDYAFIIPDDSSSYMNVELLSGEFSGVVYAYGKVSVEEDKDNDQVYLGFEYEITNDNGLENLHESPKFKNYIGDILTNIVMSKSENDNEIGTDYTETPDL